MSGRTKESFWAVWHAGMEWPQLLADEGMARERVRVLAKNSVGTHVHLMRITSVGTVEYPAEPRLSGALCAVQ